jgi:hypothetical protein
VVPAKSGQEKSLIDFLSQLAQQAGLQLGDLTKLASGEVGGPTAEDKRLVQESIGFTTDIATRGLEDVTSQLSANLGESLSARGIQGSSIEAVDQALLRRGLGQDAASMIDKSRIQGGQALLNLPFQRAGVQLNANQLLFNRITGGALPALQSLLQERLAQGTTTQTQSGFGAGDLLQLGGTVGGFLIGGPPGAAVGGAIGGAAGGAVEGGGP